VSAFEDAVIQRIKQLEREVERLQKWERPIVITDHGALTGLGDNDHPQYRKVTDSIDHGTLTGLADDDHPQYRKVADSIDHGTLSGLADNDHPQYLLTTGKAADSDKLDGTDSTGFATATHNHTGTYLPINDKAADSDKLDGLDSTAFVQISDLGVWSSWTPTQTGWTALPTGVYRYCKIGKLVMGIIYMSAGTSNSTAAELSLPFTAAKNGTSMRGTTGWAMDNGVEQTQPGTWVIYGNTKNIELYKTFPTGGWTASGTKRIVTLFFYEAA